MREKHLELAEKENSALTALKSGLYTISEVVEEYGLSRTTVSKLVKTLASGKDNRDCRGCDAWDEQGLRQRS